MSQLLRQLNNTQPGFVLASPWIDDTYALRSSWIWFPSSDVSSPVLSSFNDGAYSNVAFGKGRFVVATFYINHYRYHVWDASNTTPSTTPRASADLDPAVDENRPTGINYANGMFMSTPYNNVARAGDVLTSTNGWNWTTHAGVLPSLQGSWIAPRYNTVTGTWLTKHFAGQFYRSADAGASWTNVSTSPATSLLYEFGNSRYIATDGDYNVNRVWSSTDDGSSWQSVPIPSGMSYVNCITWNEYDSQFVIAGGNWVGDGTIDARIYTSPDGTTWTARESGSTEVALNNIKGDNAGNYIATGWTYSSGYNPTTVYMYSTDNAVTWTAGTLPASCYLPYGWADKLTWGSMDAQVADPVAGEVVGSLFSTSLYTGTAAAQTITNGIDLDGQGGLVWIKWRSGALGSSNHALYDTERGVNKILYSDGQAVEATATDSLTAFNSTGFTLGADALYGRVNYSGTSQAAWTFRKAPKFFDIVSYTGDSNSQQVLSHNLDSDPGMVIIKSTNTNGTSWWVWHRSFGANTSSSGKQMALDSVKGTRDTGTIYSGSAFDWSSPNGAYQQGSYVQGTSSTDITVGYEANNGSSWDYVAYLFAHNDGDGEFGLSGNQDIIKCGSYTGNGSTDGPEINLGWQPQWVLIKRSSGDVGNWYIFDSERGVVTGSNDQSLSANTSDAEQSAAVIDFTSTGFKITTSDGNFNGPNTIYMAIRG